MLTAVDSSPVRAENLQDGEVAPRPVDAAALKRARVSRVDYARGIAIFLVVVGHVAGGLDASNVPGDQLSNILFSLHLKNQFRMPALFMIAGIFAERGLRKGFHEYLTDKVGYLLYPYLVWNILNWAAVDVANIVGDRVGRKLVNTPPTNWWDLGHSLYEPKGHWFLFSLFATMILYGVLRKLGLRIRWVFAISILTHIIARLGLVDPWPLAFQVGRLLPFFCLGAGCAEWLLRLWRHAPLWKPVATFVGLAALMAWVSTFTIMGEDPPVNSNGHTVISSENLFLLGEKIPYRAAISLAGIGAMWCLAIVFERLHGPRIIQFWGRISMEIYIISSFGMVAARMLLRDTLHIEHAWVLVLGGIAGGMLLPMVMVFVANWLGVKHLFRWGRPSAGYPAPN